MNRKERIEKMVQEIKKEEYPIFHDSYDSFLKSVAEFALMSFNEGEEA